MKIIDKKLRAGIIRFPGSNCDYDALNFFKKYGHESRFIWYKETQMPPEINILVLPGGFAFGDRYYEKATGEYTINPGELAVKSPVMEIVFAAASKKIPILGICNGFQILVKSGLLPGKLARNDSGKFFCDNIACEVLGDSFFKDKEILGKIFNIPVAHGYGKYIASEPEIFSLETRGHIFLKYKGINPNGSVKNIAGISNEEGNIFGMMPHPERSPDGKYFIKAMEKYVFG
ncbi:MAG: phosphoribosylformylglycinamidine synthase I [Patescibacteria group bacterium]